MAVIHKEEFLRRCCELCDLNLTRPQMRGAYEAIMEVARECVLSGENVTFHGLGTFETFVKDAHTARNPSTGEPCEVPDRLMGKFHINNNLKMALREVEVVREQPKAKKGSRR